MTDQHESLRLAPFIRHHLDSILQAWESFARTIEPPALTMDDKELRDHAREMLLVFADDLETGQSDVERDAKSQGLGKRARRESAAEVHAEARLLSGYTVVQLVSEYRALRSSVLSLWGESMGEHEAVCLADMTRFNEAVDQALAESVARYHHLVSQSQNMFLAILGHDLRNPLGSLVMGSSFLMQAPGLAPEYTAVSRRMFTSAQRMNKLIDDLIDFTRTHLGPGIPVRTGAHCIVAVCEQVVGELRAAHPRRRIELAAPHEVKATFDEGRIAQALSNLIGNAIQYGRPDTPVIVTIEVESEDIVLTVNNQGDAIPADKLGAIFDPLVRLASESDQADETTNLGIGLFISRQVMHAHGGHLTVTSGRDSGTTFTVSLPRRALGAAATVPAV